MHALRRALPLVLLSALAAFAIHRAIACPTYAPPQPLRLLYELSDRVIVARVGQSVPVKNQYDFTEMRTALHVTQNLKGAGETVAHYYHWKPNETGGEGREVAVVRRLGGGPEPPRFKEGDTLLVFLDRREQGEGYEVNDAGYGLKKLSDEDLKVYVRRIEELAAITRSGAEDKGALAEWLVRCAEERATRWEGAYELMLSAEAAARERRANEKEKGGAEEGAEEDAEAAEEEAGEDEGPAEEASGEAGGGGQAQQAAGARPEDRASGESPATPEAAPAENADAEARTSTQAALQHLRRRFTKPDPSLVARLDEAQKRRLADALFSAERIGEAEEPLLEVVRDFGDARMPAFLVAQMRLVEDAPHFAVEGWLRILADLFDDEEFGKLVDDYTENATYGEEYYLEEAEAEAEAGAQAEESAEEVEEEEVEEEEEEVDVEAELAKQAAAEKRAEEKRSERLRKVLAQAEAVLASAQLARK